MSAFTDFVNSELPKRISTLEDGNGSGSLPSGKFLVTTGVGLGVATTDMISGGGLQTSDLAVLTVPIATTSNISGASFYGDGSNLSTVGVNWSSHIVGDENNSLYSVCYGNGQFVAVGEDWDYLKSLTSPDGINWTTHNYDTEFEYALVGYSVCYGNGLFVAVGSGNTSYNVMTSPDGINWTFHQLSDSYLISVCYGNGIFVAIEEDTSIANNNVYISSDGINWTTHISVSNNWKKITYGNGLFIAVGHGSSKIMTSSDGINWISRNSPISQVSFICYGNGLFFAGNYTQIMSSSDGITWNIIHQREVGARTFSIGYGNGILVAVGEGPKSTSISKDGIHWTFIDEVADIFAWDICYGNGVFVGVGEDKIISSGSIITIPTDELNPNFVFNKNTIINGTLTVNNEVNISGGGLFVNGLEVITDFSSYSLMTDVEAISSSLQGKIELLSTQVELISSGGVNYATNAYVLAVSGDLLNQINSITQGSISISGDNTLTIGQTGVNFSLSVADYISATEVYSISGDLQSKINAMDLTSFALSSNLLALSGDLQSKITNNDNDISTLHTQVTSISANFDNYATNVYVLAISGDLQSKIDNIVQETTTITGDSTLTIGQTGVNFSLSVADYISATEVYSISGDLQSKINAIDLTPFALPSNLLALSGQVYDLDVKFANYATISYVNDISGDLQSKIDNIPVVDSSDYITSTYFQSISGAPNGVATLGSDGKVPSEQLPTPAEGVILDANDKITTSYVYPADVVSASIAADNPHISYSPIDESKIYANGSTVNDILTNSWVGAAEYFGVAGGGENPFTVNNGVLTIPIEYSFYLIGNLVQNNAKSYYFLSSSSREAIMSINFAETYVSIVVELTPMGYLHRIDSPMIPEEIYFDIYFPDGATYSFLTGDLRTDRMKIKNVGQANGFATLGSDGKLTSSQLPEISGSDGLQVSDLYTLTVPVATTADISGANIYSNGILLGGSSLSNVADDGTGVRLGNVVNNIATGNFSIAEGNTTASEGSFSHAEGSNTTCSIYAIGGHTEGLQTHCHSQGGHAEGVQCYAGGINGIGGYVYEGTKGNHAEGYKTTSKGHFGAHSEGCRTKSFSAGSHSEGYSTTRYGIVASNKGSHAEGYSSIINGIVASNKGSHAEGYATVNQLVLSSGKGSHAEGTATTASGDYSHAEGRFCSAVGYASHAEGFFTQALGHSNHAEGWNTTSHGSFTHAEGYYTETSSSASHAEGWRTTATGHYSHAEGYRTTASRKATHASGELAEAIHNNTFVWSDGVAFSSSQTNTFNIHATNGVCISGGGLVVGSPTGGNKGVGTINASAVYDDNTLLTDYVFDKYFDGEVKEEDRLLHGEFEIKTIDDMVTFMKTNHHLPTIIGRKEWSEKGNSSLGQLVSQLWQTIEVQAIYIKELNERVKELEK